MKGQKQSNVKVLQNKVSALTNVIRKLIEEINELKSLSQGTLTAFQLHTAIVTGKRSQCSLR